MKTSLSFVLFLFVGQLLMQAQQYRFSVPEKIPSKVTDFDIIGSADNKIFLHKYGNNFHIVEAFDSETLSRKWQKELKLEGKRASVLDIFPVKEGLLVFYSQRQKSTVYVYGRLYDHQLQPLKEPREIVSFQRNFGSSSFTLDLVSDDRDEYFAILRKVNGTLGYKEVDFLVVNRKFEKLQELKTLDLDGDTRYGGTLISPNGEVVTLVGQLRRNLFAGSTTFEGIQAHVFSPGRDNKIISLQSGDRKIREFAAEWDHINEQLVVAGYFSRDQSRVLDGFFSFHTDLSKTQTVEAKYGYFDDSIADYIVREKQPKRKEKDSYNRYNRKYFTSRFAEIELRDMIIRSDGGLLMIGESSRIVDTGGARDPFYDNRYQGSINTPREYFYDDVMALSVNNDGTIDWVQILPKQQYSQDDQGYYSSIGVMNGRNKIRLIFNETISQRLLNEFVLSASGNYRVRSLLKTKEFKVRTAARYAKQISATEIVIPTFQDNDKMMLLKFSY